MGKLNNKTKMKRKLIYQAPLTEEFELELEGTCLTGSDDVTVDNPADMPWGD